MIKFFVLVLLLTIPAYQQQQNLGFSGDGSDISGEELKAQQVLGSNFYSQPPRTIARQPTDLKALEKSLDSNLPQGKWIYPPNGGPSIFHPIGKFYCWTITFCTNCIRNAVTLHVGGTGHVFVQLNPPTGSWPLIWGAPWTLHKVKIPPQCGSNRVRICVYNKWWRSPLGMWYWLSQDKTDCYKCPFNQYYDYQNCQCRCTTPSNCCRNPLIQDRNTCQCVRPWIQTDIVGVTGIRP